MQSNRCPSKCPSSHASPAPGTVVGRQSNSPTGVSVTRCSVLSIVVKTFLRKTTVIARTAIVITLVFSSHRKNLPRICHPHFQAVTHLRDQLYAITQRPILSATKILPHTIVSC